MSPGNQSTGDSHGDGSDVRSPMEAHGGYRGDNWSPERLLFHQNLETFAERVGLIVGLQGNGKISQEEAYAQIKRIWKTLKQSKDTLIDRA
ncbi:MAG: hypothetical protein VKO39_14130 [Cyanobacteriota bacterium]|nr:hypothetical protein [Cyanobacteriota bacterium]